MADAPGQFHTILSDGLRPDIEATEQERQQIELHIGRFIITMGLMELWLGMAVESLAAPANPEEFHRIISNLHTGGRIRHLRALLPAGWRDGEALLNLLSDTNAYRNDVAHPVVAMSGSDAQGNLLGWHLANFEGRRGSRLFTAASIERQELDARILSLAVAVLLRDEYLSAKTVEEARQFPLADAIINEPGMWSTHQEHAAFCRRVRQLFPGD